MQETPQKPKLTLRELEVLRLVCEGYSNKMIADKMGVTVKTTINQRARVYSKMNVHCTADLIRKAVKLKLIEL